MTGSGQSHGEATVMNTGAASAKTTTLFGIWNSRTIYEQDKMAQVIAETDSGSKCGVSSTKANKNWLDIEGRRRLKKKINDSRQERYTVE